MNVSGVFFIFLYTEISCIVNLVRCWRSWQHLGSYHDGYQLVTVCTDGDFVVLSHWEIKPLTPWLDIPLSYYPDTELTCPCPILLMPSARLGRNKYQFYKPLVCLDQEANSQSSTSEAHSLPIEPPR